MLLDRLDKNIHQCTPWNISIIISSLENLDIIADSDVDLIEKEGFHIFNVTGVHVKFSIGGLKLNMGNLFDGHRILGNEPANHKTKSTKFITPVHSIFRGIYERLFERKLEARGRVPESNLVKNHRGPYAWHLAACLQ